MRCFDLGGNPIARVGTEFNGPHVAVKETIDGFKHLTLVAFCFFDRRIWLCPHRGKVSLISKEAGGKLGIEIFSAKIGGESQTHTENMSRLSFSIPVVLPTAHVKSEQELFDEADEKRKQSLRLLREKNKAEFAKDTTNS